MGAVGEPLEFWARISWHETVRNLGVMTFHVYFELRINPVLPLPKKMNGSSTAVFDVYSESSVCAETPK